MKKEHKILLLILSMGLILPVTGWAQTDGLSLSGGVPKEIEYTDDLSLPGGVLKEIEDYELGYTNDDGIAKLKSDIEQGESDATEREIDVLTKQAYMEARQDMLNDADAAVEEAYANYKENQNEETREAFAKAKNEQRAANIELAKAQADLAEALQAEAENKAELTSTKEKLALEQALVAPGMETSERMKDLEAATDQAQAAERQAQYARDMTQISHDEVSATRRRVADQYRGMFGGLNLSDLVDNDTGQHREILGDTLGHWE